MLRQFCRALERSERALERAERALERAERALERAEQTRKSLEPSLELCNIERNRSEQPATGQRQCTEIFTRLREIKRWSGIKCQGALESQTADAAESL